MFKSVHHVRSGGRISCLAWLRRLWPYRRVRQHVYEGPSLGKDTQTDCSINAQLQGKTYCFGSKEAMASS